MKKLIKPFKAKESGIVFVGKTKWGEYFEDRGNGRAHGYAPVSLALVALIISLN